MGNPKHLLWIKEGVERWNKRRIEEPFIPDLQGEDISGIFGVDHAPRRWLTPHPALKGINLSNSKLNGAILENLDLSGSDFSGAHLTDDARLCGSQFTGARFSHTQLIGARMGSCILTGARFEMAKLQEADFTGADLTNAEFFHCQLEGTDFLNANLNGAEFPLSRPWKAHLYGRHTGINRYMDAFEVDYINSVAGLVEQCREFRTRYGDDVVLYFRGESSNSTDWKLSPKVMRAHEKPDHPGLRLVEGELLNDLKTREPGAFNTLGSALGEWVLAQHFKLPTRFLDVTRDPLVALFNACYEKKYKCEDGRLHIFAVPRSLIKPYNSDTVSVIANFAKLPQWEKNLLLGKVAADVKGEYEFHRLASFKETDLLSRVKIRLYDGIRQEKPYFAERIDARDLFRVFVVEPQRMFERIRAQSGAFLISAFHERFEYKEVLDWNKHIPIYSHFPKNIDANAKKSLLDELQMLNITKASL